MNYSQSICINNNKNRRILRRISYSNFFFLIHKYFLPEFGVIISIRSLNRYLFAFRKSSRFNLNNFNILLNSIPVWIARERSRNDRIERKWCKTRLTRDSIRESIICLFVSDRGGCTIEPIYPSSDLESPLERCQWTVVAFLVSFIRLLLLPLYSPRLLLTLSPFSIWIPSSQTSMFSYRLEKRGSIISRFLGQAKTDKDRLGSTDSRDYREVLFKALCFIVALDSIKIIFSSVFIVKFIIRCIAFNFFFFFLRMLFLLLLLL